MKNSLTLCALLLLMVACASAPKTKPNTANPATTPTVAPTVATQNTPTTAAYIQDRQAAIQAALRNVPQPVLVALPTDSLQKKALDLAFANQNFVQYVRNPQGTPLLNEIFGIYKARPADLPTDLQPTCNGNCYRIEMYNYALNLTTICIVDINKKQIYNINHYAAAQPDIPNYLKQIALQIATNDPEVIKALGYPPTQAQALMASTKTALNRTRCERSKHLCVAPTFTQNGKALWAIIDLTDLKMVGIRWTNTGTTQPITERRYQNETIAECFCEKINTLKQNGWAMKYYLTSSDGLRIDSVMYNDNLVINAASLVDWHVSYSNTEGFGYSDAVGCPTFSHAAVIAVEPPKIIDLLDANKQKIGFVLEQNYWSEGWPTPCNYSYCQRYEFYDDGRFRMANASLGRGCGNDGTYRPVARIDWAGKNSFFEYKNDNTWQQWQQEKWQLQTAQTTYTPEGYQYKIQDAQGNGFFVEPAKGQFNDGSRNDNAYTYITQKHTDRDEGNTELVTIGPCCNTDHQQGPEKFMENEDIQNKNLVLWYVPQLKNDDTPNNLYCWAETTLKNGVYQAKSYPCFGGAMFVPIKTNKKQK